MDLYRWQPGEHVTLPLGGGRRIAVTVAGVFRDYGRSTGSVVIARSIYVAATGDTTANEAVFWLERGARAATVVEAMRAKLEGVAVAGIDGNMCTACRNVLPQSAISAVKLGKVIVKCQNCRRMLYPSDAW